MVPNEIQMKTPKEIAEIHFGAVDWQDAQNGFCTCPGASRHTRPTHPKDCHIFLAGIPTVYCFHVSCRDSVEAANRGFRSAIARVSPFDKGQTPPSPLEQGRRREKASVERLKCRAHHSRSQILADYTTDPADLFEQSPCRLLEGPNNDWRLLLSLFPSTDTVWIGNVSDSGPGHERNFRTVADWQKGAEAPGAFTCPSAFKLGAYSRSKENIVARRYLVVESDLLTKPEICAVFAWLHQFLPLRAVVDTAGKSLHGWFDFPKNPEIERELKIILPALGCDPAMFKPSQPCRLPGARRGDKCQALIYLNLQEIAHE
jgi:hypothetical protein